MPNVLNCTCFETRIEWTAPGSNPFQIAVLDHHEGKLVFSPLRPAVSGHLQVHVDQLHSCFGPLPCFGRRSERVNVSRKTTFNGLVAAIKRSSLDIGRVHEKLVLLKL